VLIAAFAASRACAQGWRLAILGEGPERYGQFPTNLATALERFIPAALYRRLQFLLSYAMNVYCLGQRR